jgi:hypothetical protein
MANRVKFVGDCRHAKEVSLYGTADLRFWSQKLAKEGLVPLDNGGKAQIIIIGGNMKYKGIEFTEVSFSVFIEPPLRQASQSAFLVQAFNSSLLFSFCERAFFSTPYRHAECQLSASVHASVHVCRTDQVLFEARMAGDIIDRKSTASDAEWTGEIVLPGREGARVSKQKYYVAHLSGDARTFPFLPEQDALRLQPLEGSNHLQWLIDCSFSPTSWLIRDDARHARTKTYVRARV